MARTIQQVAAQIDAQMANYPALLPLLANTSMVAIWRLIRYCVAYSIVSLENIYDTHKADITNMLALQKPHTKRWYQQKALAYQHGGVLKVDDDTYDNIGLTDAQVESQKIIKRAAVEEKSNLLLVKVVKLIGTDPTPLDVVEMAAFASYVNEIKDAGVPILVRSELGDSFILELDVYYDPTILSSTGARLDGSNAEPVLEAANNFISLMPFNGVLIKSELVDEIQSVQGVVTPVVTNCLAGKFGGNLYSVDAYYQSHAGYLTIYDVQDVFITYKPYDL
jgi:hypothetical protein